MSSGNAISTTTTTILDDEMTDEIMEDDLMEEDDVLDDEMEAEKTKDEDIEDNDEEEDDDDDDDDDNKTSSATVSSSQPQVPLDSPCDPTSSSMDRGIDPLNLLDQEFLSSKDPREWSVQEVMDFMTAIGCPAHAPSFQKQVMIFLHHFVFLFLLFFLGHVTFLRFDFFV